MISGLTILPFRANWAGGVTLRSTFATNQGIESSAGSMTRTALRDYGQRQIKFKLLPDRDFRRQWDAFREVNPPGTLLGIPLWSEQGIVLTANASAGATSLSVSSTAFVDWRGEGVLVSAFPAGSPQALTVEGFEISSISGNTITIPSPGLTNAFNAGDEVLPLMRGRQVADYGEDVLSPEVSEIELTFDEALNYMSAVAFTTAPTYPSYIGLPVLPLIADWSQSPKSSITQGTHYVAQGLNAESLAVFQIYLRQRVSHRVGMDGLADRALLWQFFHDRKGRYDRFWLPALKDELKLSANISSGDTTLQLLNSTQFASRYDLGADLRRAIFITDGFNYWIRQIINLSGGTNRVTINNPLGSAVSMNQCQIGLLTLVQFAADDLMLDLQAPVVATANLAFTELEKEYAEVIGAGSGDASGTRVGMELVA
ncbi:MAG: hypothetical protein ACLPT4_16765 [Verrucomicrobiia bacterium]